MNPFFYTTDAATGRKVIFEDQDVQVFHDGGDDGLPIHIQVLDSTGEWLDFEQAEQLARSIFGALDLEPKPAAADTNVALLQVAAASGLKVSFRYAKGDDERYIETRTLQPAKVDNQAGHLIVIGFDPDRDEPRAFRVDRIKGKVTVVGDA